MRGIQSQGRYLPMFLAVWWIPGSGIDFAVVAEARFWYDYDLFLISYDHRVRKTRLSVCSASLVKIYSRSPRSLLMTVMLLHTKVNSIYSDLSSYYEPLRKEKVPVRQIQNASPIWFRSTRRMKHQKEPENQYWILNLKKIKHCEPRSLPIIPMSKPSFWIERRTSRFKYPLTSKPRPNRDVPDCMFRSVTESFYNFNRVEIKERKCTIPQRIRN